MGTAVPFLLLGPRLPGLHLELAVERHIAGGDSATERLLRAAVLPLGVIPRCLRIGVAIEGVASPASSLATPNLLLGRPALFPIRESSVAIEWHMRRSVGASIACMVATPILLVLRPAQFPIAEVFVAVEGNTSSAYHLTAPSLLLAWPRHLVIVEPNVTIEDRVCCSGASSFLVRAAPLFLLVLPLLLPIVESMVAVKWVTSTTHSFAAPLLLLFRPAFLPLIESSMTIEGALHSGSSASTLLVGATPILLGIGPSLLPDGKLDAAIKRVACPTCHMTAPTLLLRRPERFPLVELVVAIEWQILFGSILAALASMVAAPLLFLRAPTLFPLVIPSVAIESTASFAGRSAAESFLLVCPALFPILSVHIAIVQHCLRRGLATHAFICATPGPLLLGP